MSVVTALGFPFVANARQITSNTFKFMIRTKTKSKFKLY